MSIILSKQMLATMNIIFVTGSVQPFTAAVTGRRYTAIFSDEPKTVKKIKNANKPYYNRNNRW